MTFQQIEIVVVAARLSILKSKLSNTIFIWKNSIWKLKHTFYKTYTPPDITNAITLMYILFRECRLSIFVNTERALQLFQPSAGCSLSLRYDLPVYHDVGGLEKSWIWNLDSYNYFPFFPLSSKCDIYDGLNLYDVGNWVGEVRAVFLSSFQLNLCEGT